MGDTMRGTRLGRVEGSELWLLGRHLVLMGDPVRVVSADEAAAMAHSLEGDSGAWKEVADRDLKERVSPAVVGVLARAAREDMPLAYGRAFVRDLVQVLVLMASFRLAEEFGTLGAALLAIGALVLLAYYGGPGLLETWREVPSRDSAGGEAVSNRSIRALVGQAWMLATVAATVAATAFYHAATAGMEGTAGYWLLPLGLGVLTGLGFAIAGVSQGGRFSDWLDRRRPQGTEESRRVRSEAAAGMAAVLAERARDLEANGRG